MKISAEPLAGRHRKSQLEAATILVFSGFQRRIRIPAGRKDGSFHHVPVLGSDPQRGREDSGLVFSVWMIGIEAIADDLLTELRAIAVGGFHEGTSKTPRGRAG